MTWRRLGRQKPIVPQRLRLLEIDPVLGLVGRALGGIVFEAHGIENILKLLRINIPVVVVCATARTRAAAPIGFQLSQDDCNRAVRWPCADASRATFKRAVADPSHGLIQVSAARPRGPYDRVIG